MLSMKVIYNNIIPFPGFKAINMFGVLFVRKGCTMKETDINHEMIHTAQMKEMGYVLYYVWYLVEWLIKLAMLRDFHKAYRAVSFEREAYTYEPNLIYLNLRNKYAWREYIVKSKILKK